MPKKVIVTFDLRKLQTTVLQTIMVTLLYAVKFIYLIGKTTHSAFSLLCFTIYRGLFLTVRKTWFGELLKKWIRHTPGSRTFDESFKIFWHGFLRELLHFLTGIPKKTIVLPVPKHLLRKYFRAFIRRLILYGAPVAAAVLLTVLIFSAQKYTMGVSVKINGKTVGVLASKSDFSEIEHRVDSYVTAVTGETFNALEHSTVSFDVTLANKGNFENTQPIESALIAGAGDTISESYCITVDGEIIGAYDKKEELDKLLEALKNEYKPKDDPKARVEFVQDVRVVRKVLPKGMVISLDQIKQRLKAQKTSERTYTVVKNDVFVSIAKSFDMTTGELEKLNPAIHPDKLQIGMKLVVEHPVSFLPVKVIKTEKTTESIPYKVTAKDTNTLYTGQVSYSQKGKKGIADISSEVFLVDGVEVSRSVVSRAIRQQPVTQIELHGTKKLPAKVATGNYRWPVSGYISSPFGYRHGDYHTGMDIAAHLGTPIVAADGGTVVFAAYSGSYGKLVKIDHGNGYQTWYAHCSSILVKKGQKVAKGETIAKVGSTGNSTGPHCHFEVRKNGKYQNPRNYLP